MDLLGKLRDWFNRDIQIQVLELKRSRTFNKKDLPKRLYKGVVIESDVRKMIDIGSSIGATMPENQAYLISDGVAFRREFILLDDGKQIMVYTQLKGKTNGE